VLKTGHFEKFSETPLNFEIWSWRRIEKWNCVKNERALNGVKEKRNILHTVKRRKFNWIGHILRTNCLLKHFIVGKKEGK
jgi:hypothetical protein